MACDGCTKQNGKPFATASGLPYRLVSSSNMVTGKQGRRYPIGTCLIPPSRRPREGWSVEFYIHGQPHVIDGVPRSIYRETQRLFELNDVPYDNLELWFNLNLQWLSSAVDKYQKVTFDQLFALASPNPQYHEQVPE